MNRANQTPRIDTIPEELRNLKNEVYAALETGNHEHAKSAARLIRDAYPNAYLELRNELIRDYGLSV